MSGSLTASIVQSDCALRHNGLTNGTVTVLILRVNGFTPILQGTFFEDRTGPLSDLNGVDPEAYGRTSGQDIAFCYITYGLFDMRQTQSEIMSCTSYAKTGVA